MSDQPIFNMEIQGLDAVMARFQQHAEALPRAVGNALLQFAGNILDRSQDLVPVDLGNLRASGFVDAPRVDQDGVSVTIGYGGPAGGTGHAIGGGNQEDVGYAWRQHEDLTLNHPNGGQAKFLEAPAAAMMPDLPRWIAAALNEEFGR